MEKIIIGIFGGLIGFGLPYAAKTLETLTKARRIKSALFNEAKSAKKEIEAKLKWLSRDVSDHLNEVEEIKIIEYRGRKLYLGEQETFDIKCKYWQDRYCEIAEILSEDDFSYFAGLHRLIGKFIEKFEQMKAAFRAKIGDPQWMALACYKDLAGIREEIEQRLTAGSKGMRG